MSQALTSVELGRPGGSLATIDVLPIEIAGAAPDGSPYTYSELFDRFASSPWGVHQSAQLPRFSGIFGYEPTRMHEDLGEAIDPVVHNTVVHRDVQQFLVFNQRSRAQDISPRQVVAGRLAVQFHDTGESTHYELRELCGGVVGDIAHGRKTAADRACEHRVLEKIFETHLGDLPEWLTTEALGLITHDPSVGDEPHHHLLEAGHHYGELQTGIRAGLVAMRAISQGEMSLRVMQLRRLSTMVVPQHQKTLEADMAVFPFIDQVLDATAPVCDRILSELGTYPPTTR